MLYLETIQPDTLGLLKRIQALPIFSETRLVGGTALALHYQSWQQEGFHRRCFSLESVLPEGDVGVVSKQVSNRVEIACHAQFGLF